MNKLSPVVIDLALAVLVSVMFSLAAGYGLPQILDPDEGTFVSAAGRILAGPTFDPGWYGHPAATLIYPLAAVYGVLAVLGLATGFFADLTSVQELYFDDPTIFFVTGRVLSALYGGICAFVLFRLMRAFGIKNFWTVLAAILFFLSPVLFDYGTKIRADFILSAFLLLTILSAIRAVHAAEPFRWMMVAGVCVGLAVTSKYPGVIAAIAVIAAALTLWRDGRLTAFGAMRQLSAAGAASVLAAFVAAPYLFIRFQAVFENILKEARPAHLSATSDGFLPAVLFYALDVMPSALGVPLAALSLVGLLLLSGQKSGRIVAVTALIFLLFIASLNLVWVRWAIPLIPVAMLAGFFALQRAETAFLPRRWRVVARGLSCLVLLVPALYKTAPLAYAKMTNNDTRVEARGWVQENIPEGAKILVEAYAPNLDTQTYDVLVSQGGRFQRWERLEPTRIATPLGPVVAGWDGKTVSQFAVQLYRTGIDYVILSNWESRFRAEQENYGDFLLMYQTLEENYERIKTFQPTKYKMGPSITVLKVR